MVDRSRAFYLGFLLLLITNKQSFAQEMIDIYTANVTVQWTDLSQSICEPPTTTKPMLRPTTSTCGNTDFIGPHCDITSNPCVIGELCQNGGSCYSNNSLYHKYYCQCPPGIFGELCENDTRICKTNTCWHGGHCVIMEDFVSRLNQTTFDCNCIEGYDGTQCEFLENMCQNITCENRGICFSSFLNWTCECPGSWMFHGRYCEQKSTRLVALQILSKSFASIAIAAIITLFAFVIIMDILKYGFAIDPVDRERRLMRLEQEKKQAKKKTRKKTSKTALRLYHIV